MFRNLMLRFAASPRLLNVVSKVGIRYRFAHRFIAGETIEEAIRVVSELNSRAVLASIDMLGEGVRDEREAKAAADAYSALLARISQEGINANISVKLTQLGLDVSQDLCRDNLVQILERARQVQNFVCVDMESSAHTQRTLDLFSEVYDHFPCQVGTVIQSYLYRSEKDVQNLSQKGCSIRLCKGAYKEPPEVAFPKKADVDRNYISLLEILLVSPAYTAIATHDDAMIDHARRFIANKQVPAGKYEFQMLYGVRRESQFRLARQGYKMRVYVPYGRHWAPYYMRRLAERPANVFFIAKNLFRK